MHKLLIGFLVVCATSVSGQAPYWSKGDHLASWIVQDTFSYALYDTLSLALHNPYPDTLHIWNIALPGGTPVNPPDYIPPNDSSPIVVAVQYYGVGEGVRIYDHRVTVRGNLYVPVVSQYVVLVNTDEVIRYIGDDSMPDSMYVGHLPKPYHIYCHDDGSLREIGQKTSDGKRKLGAWYRFKKDGSFHYKRAYSRIAWLNGYADTVLQQVNFTFRCNGCDTFSAVWDGYAAQGQLLLYLPNAPGTLRLNQGEQWAEWHLDDRRQGEVSLFWLPLHDSSTIHYRATYYTGWLILDSNRVVVKANGSVFTQGHTPTFFQYLTESGHEPAIFNTYINNWCTLIKPAEMPLPIFMAQLAADTMIAEVGQYVNEAVFHSGGPLAYFGKISIIIDPMTIPNDGYWQQAFYDLGLEDLEMVQGTYVSATLPLRVKDCQQRLFAIQELPWVRAIELEYAGTVSLPEVEVEH